MTGIGKYFAALVILLAMMWTWDLAHSDRELGLDKRRAIESTLQETIVQYIKSQRPGVTDVIFQQLFSEDLPSKEPGTKEMLVRFRYVTDESIGTSGDMTEQVFEGSVRLRSKDGSTWEWVNESVSSPMIRYKNGSEIKAGSGQEPTAAPAEDPNQSDAQKDHQH
ncbi:MAG: hypothetical protein JNJ49_09285 [Bdellovibrionaceae bacterium]|nr:hypothetical protein [Pseudobdellovibrionaceae bacterium]